MYHSKADSSTVAPATEVVIGIVTFRSVLCIHLYPPHPEAQRHRKLPGPLLMQFECSGQVSTEKYTTKCSNVIILQSNWGHQSAWSHGDTYYTFAFYAGCPPVAPCPDMGLTLQIAARGQRTWDLCPVLSCGIVKILP